MKNKIHKNVLIPFTAIFFAATMHCLGAYNIYLNLNGVQGEVTNSAYLNQIAVNSFTQGVSVAVSPGAGGNTVSRPTFTDITIVKSLDTASPTLFLNCASGHHFSTAVLTFQDQPGNPTAFYTVTLQDVIITSVQSGGIATGSRPTENVTLNFQSIVWTYQKVNSSGNPVGTAITHNWNLATNSGS